MAASEIEARHNSSTNLKDRPAIKTVRDMKSLHGAGVYTSLEIFAMAGA